KQTVDAEQVAYAQKKIESVRALARTSLPVPHVGGTAGPKDPHRIIGGLLVLESDWNPPLGKPLSDALDRDRDVGQIDLGCVASHGTFAWSGEKYELDSASSAATRFLFELIARLQGLGTVPMIDVRAYSRWLQ